jgi:hypothetical protein
MKRHSLNGMSIAIDADKTVDAPVNSGAPITVA